MQVMGRSARMARHHKRHKAADINLTSMIDMFTILVFFLLVHGGFVRLALLQLNLPTSQTAADDRPPEFQLEVTVRKNGIEIGDRTAGLLDKIDRSGDDYHLDKLTDYLAHVKQQFPDKADATVLLEPDISYEVLVAVMDRVRINEHLDPATHRWVRSELFPDISIGDAPVPN